MPKGFLIYFAGRTGSTFLVERLKEHPQINAFGERFGTELLDGEPQTGDGQIAFVRKKLRPHLLREEQTSPISVGWKIQIHPGNWQIIQLQRFKKVVQEYDLVHFHLTRENVVKQAVSSLRARELHNRTSEELGHGYANVRSNFSDRLGAASIEAMEVEPKKLEQMIEGIRRSEQVTAEYVADFAHVENITYEDIVGDKPKFIDWFCDTIGQEKIEWPEGEEVLKLTNDDLRQSISNIDELVELYSGSEIGSMLEEGLSQPVGR